MSVLARAAILSIIFFGGNFAQAALYEQPPVVPGAWSISDTVDLTGGRRAYDNFVLPWASTVTSVSWWGGNIDSVAPYDNPPDLDVLQFEIAVWANDNSQPGQMLFGEIRSMADVTFSEVQTVTDPTVGPLTYYRFDLDLDKSFQLDADTQYWLSVMAFSPTTNPWFNWVSGQGGPGDGSMTHNLFNQNIGFFPDDRAFALGGVPIPAAVWLLGSALGVFVLAGRRPRVFV